MPRLPAPEEYGRPTPQSTRQVVDIRPSPVGETISRFGRDMSQMAEEETKKLDVLAADTALTKLEDERMRRTFDPKDGFTRIQGTAILDKNNPILKTVPESFGKSIEALAGALTPQQQQIFRAKAARVANSLKGDLYRHVAAQTEKAYDESDSARLKQAASIVGVDPSRLDQKVGEVSEVLSNRFSRVGETDAAIQSVARTEALMPLINAAMKAHTTGDNPNFEAARQVMKTYDDIIPEAAKKALNEEIHKEERNKIATELATDLFEAYRTDSVKLTHAEKILNTYGKDDPKLRETARQIFYQNVGALKTEREEVLGDLIGQVRSSPKVGTLAAIKRSEAYKTLGEKERGDLDYTARELAWQQQMRAEHNSDHAQALIDRADRKKMDDPAAFGAYAALYTSPDLPAMSDNQIMAQERVLGRQYVKDLLLRKKQLLTETGRFDLAPAQIDPLQFGITDKNEQKMVKAAIYSNLTAWKEQNRGRVPTAGEQDTIIKNALLKIPLQRSVLGVNVDAGEMPTYLREKQFPDKKTIYRGTDEPVAVPKEFYDWALKNKPTATSEEMLKWYPIWKRKNDELNAKGR